MKFFQQQKQENLAHLGPFQLIRLMSGSLIFHEFPLKNNFYLNFKNTKKTCSVYFTVRIIKQRSSKSNGIPCGDPSDVPRILVIPRFVAITKIGERSDSI